MDLGIRHGSQKEDTHHMVSLTRGSQNMAVNLNRNMKNSPVAAEGQRTGSLGSADANYCT